MDVNAEHKQSEVGAIPADWTAPPLSKLMRFQNGVNADKKAYGAGIPFINVLEVITNSHLTNADIPGRVTLPKQIAESFAVERGDIFFNRTSETQDEVGLASVYLDDRPAVFGGFVIRGRPISDQLLPEFAGYALRSVAVRTQIIARGQGAIRANVGQAELRKVFLPLPRPPEQKTIAKALRDADEFVHELIDLVTKQRLLKQGAKQELLSGRRRLPGFETTLGFKQTDAGSIPNDWTVSKLSKLCSMKSGTGITAANIDPFSPYPCYGGNGLRGFTSRFTHDGTYALIGRQGALCGNVVGVSGRFFASEHAVVVTAFPDTDIRWLTHALEMMRLNRYSESSAQPGLSVSKISQLIVGHPVTKNEQAAIAEVISKIDDEICVLEKKESKARDLRKGMEQALLTGRIRLP